MQPDPSFVEPVAVLQTAATATGNNTALSYTWQDSRPAYSFMVFLRRLPERQAPGVRHLLQRQPAGAKRQALQTAVSGIFYRVQLWMVQGHRRQL